MKFAAVMYQPPESIEDFFQREEQRVRRLAQKFGVPPEESEDFWMEMVLKFHRKALGDYNPSKGAWATWVYNVVRNEAVNFGKRTGRDAMAYASRIADDAIYESPTTSKQMTTHIDRVSLTSQSEDMGFRQAEDRLLLNQLESFLDNKVLHEGESFQYDVLQFNRGMEEEYTVKDKKSLGAMFRMLRHGKQQKEIAAAFEMAESSVVNHKKTIRRYAEALGYHQRDVRKP